LENIEFIFFKKVIKKYNVSLFLKDTMGILTHRNYNDNFKYIFKTGYSCDAVPLMLAMNDKIKNSNITIDVGANIGVTSIWLAKNSRIVYSFEPQRKNIERFRANLIANNINNVLLTEKAVSDNSGELEFYIHESYGHHSLGKVGTSKIIGVEKVQVITLTDFCKNMCIEEIDFLKVDVEGFEIEVFKGARELFINRKVKICAFEISEGPLKSLNKSEKHIFDFFDSVRYEIFYLDGQRVDTTNFKLVAHIDLIAIPKEVSDE
jgi:FkbM family methyltransferase